MERPCRSVRTTMCGPSKRVDFAPVTTYEKNIYRCGLGARTQRCVRTHPPLVSERYGPDRRLPPPVRCRVPLEGALKGTCADGTWSIVRTRPPKKHVFRPGTNTNYASGRLTPVFPRRQRTHSIGCFRSELYLEYFGNDRSENSRNRQRNDPGEQDRADHPPVSVPSNCTDSEQ